ncbi:MAG: hypothetical protein AAF667_13005 [Pseudomonadota bacterium]
MRSSVLIPSVGAGVAFVAATDALLGVGAVDLLLELCLSDPESDAKMPELPMKHGTGSVPYLATGAALSSAALFSMWRQDVEPVTCQTAPPQEAEFGLLSALAILANLSPKYGPEDIVDSYTRWTGQPLDLEQATASYDLFSPDTLEDDIDLFGGVVDLAERARIICAALDFPRYSDDPAKMFRVIDAIANAMNMGLAEIAQLWALNRPDADHNHTVPRRRPSDLAPFLLVLTLVVGTWRAQLQRWLDELRISTPKFWRTSQ